MWSLASEAGSGRPRGQRHARLFSPSFGCIGPQPGGQGESAEVAHGGVVVSGGEPAPVFEPVEAVFDL